MTATAVVTAIEELISIASQRLLPQALRRLSIAGAFTFDWLRGGDALADDGVQWLEILGEHGGRVLVLALPTKEELGVPSELEPAYNRLVKFSRLHEPTGYESDVTQKHNVVRLLSLKEMLYASKEAKIPHIRALCFQKIVQWFDKTTEAGPINGVIASASTPILPPRMSPKRTSALNDPTTTKSSCQGPILNGSPDVMLKAAILQKLEKYKMPDLKGSHIRRVAQLKSQGIDVPEDDDEIPITTRPENDPAEDGILEPNDYDIRDRKAKIKATFKNYEPETEAEFAVNQIWLERQRAEKLERQKEEDVRGKVRSWSMRKSRDESEYLRKQEAVQMAAGLEKFVDGEIEVLSQPRHRHLEKKRQEWQAIHQSAPQDLAVDTVQPNTEMPRVVEAVNFNQVGETSTPTRASSGGPQSIRKKKSVVVSAAAGGMHYRNQLPANYTPQSKRSNGTPMSFSSKSDSSPNTPLSSSSSGKLALLDKAAIRGSGRVMGYCQLSDSLLESDESLAVDEGEYNRVRLPNESHLKFPERIQEQQQQLKFESFHSSSHMRPGTLPLARAVSASAINYKLYPRGTIPPQSEPADPEYQHLHIAANNRKPPLRISILPNKPFASNGKSGTVPKAVARGNNQLESNAQTRSTRLTSSSGAFKRISDSSSRSTISDFDSGGFSSDFRTEQMHEVERIRVLFEQHNVSLPIGVLERGLLLPEDRSSLECTQNLPLPGSRLVSNPLLQVKLKAKVTKKKKKKKSSKGGAKKSKTKTSAGDRTKRPSKKKK